MVASAKAIIGGFNTTRYVRMSEYLHFSAVSLKSHVFKRQDGLSANAQVNKIKCLKGKMKLKEQERGL